jgi:hypothetical protein
MSFSRPIQWYHSHADPIWPEGTFKSKTKGGYLRHSCDFYADSPSSAVFSQGGNLYVDC